jgi:hypothetical protein
VSPRRPTHSNRHLLRAVFTLVAVAAAAVLAVTPAAQAATTISPTTGALRICTGCADHGLSDGSRYSYVVLHTWQSGLIPGLKADNSNIKVLVYKDASVTASYACKNRVDDPLLPTGVGYCYSDQNRPEWFLLDSTGNRIQSCSWSSLWLMDVGNAAYQQKWLDNVAADAKTRGFDGVLLDDVNQNQSGHLCGKTIAKYPQSDAFTSAMSSFMAKVGPGLAAKGLLVMPNIFIANWWQASGIAAWDSFLSYSSGAVQEYFTKWSMDSGQWFTDDGGPHNDWTYRQEFLKRTQAVGKIFLGLTYAPSADQRSMRYARASFLVDWNGGPSALVFEPTTPEAQDPYNPVWTKDIGQPLGAKFKVGLAWRRNYSGGVVVINPSTSQQTVSLGGVYTTTTGAKVTSLTLSSADAELLIPSQSPPPPPPPPPPGAPANTALPTISGNARAGRALSATTGSWTGKPTSYAYAWLRCDSQGASCAAITSAASSSYHATSTDVGSRLRVRVTATNAAGSTSAVSDPTAPVQASGKVKLPDVA